MQLWETPSVKKCRLLTMSRELPYPPKKTSASWKYGWKESRTKIPGWSRLKSTGFPNMDVCLKNTVQNTNRMLSLILRGRVISNPCEWYNWYIIINHVWFIMTTLRRCGNASSNIDNVLYRKIRLKSIIYFNVKLNHYDIVASIKINDLPILVVQRDFKFM